MGESITIRDFKSGWIPSDDAINGRKDGMLQMDNVHLDSNGAISLIGGTSVKWSGFPADSHSLYSRVMNGTRREYSALVDGSIYRDQTSIATGGDTSNAAFGTAFNYTLIASGTSKLYKDDGATAVNLGVLEPTAAPIVATGALATPFKKIGDLALNTVAAVGASAVVGSYLQMTASGAGIAAVQTYNGAGAPYNNNLLTNTDRAFGAANTGYALDSDTVNFTGFITNPYGKSLKLDILLVAGDNVGTPVSDYYSYKIDDISTLTFDPVSGVFTVVIRRDEFTRIGNGVQDWSTVYGFRLTLTSPTGADVINIFGSIVSTTELRIQGGTNAQNGTYQYLQVNVNNTGSYLAQSIAGPVTNPITVVNSQVAIVPQNPTAIDTQVNEVWIYRRGGLLDTWYRIAVFTTPWTVLYDTMGDLAAIALDKTLNLNLSSVRSLTEKIYAMIGPIEGRWYYFTASFMYPSDINCPDLIDTTLAVRTCGSNSEIFLGAKQVSDSLVIVSTSIDFYILTGTFKTLPDFTVDIYYKPLGCKFPAITYDMESYSGDVVYLASDGWRTINAGGDNKTLVAPNTDMLYRGSIRYGYSASNLKIAPGASRFPVCIGKNKVWCFMPGTNRCEVWDFIRQYWRTFNYGLGDVSNCYATQDGQIIAFYKDDNKIREIDISTSKLIDAATNQTVTLLFPVHDNGTPKQRKDSQTLKLRLYTGSSGTLTAKITTDAGLAVTISSAVSSAFGVTEVDFDLSSIASVALIKTYQLSLTGAVSDLTLNDAEIYFQTRPPQTTFTKVYNNNFGSGKKKRLRVWPCVIDTLGNNVVFTPYVDNVATYATSINNSNKNTELMFYYNDAKGIDYGGTISGGLHEFFGMLEPDIVQAYPIARRFDQVGPAELFRYGKIKQLEVRILPDGGVTIPYTIYFNDTSIYTGNLTVVDGKEESYFIDLPKGVAGNIVRITLGPTGFNFHRFYLRAQVARSGDKTELEWINLGEQG